MRDGGCRRRRREDGIAEDAASVLAGAGRVVEVAEILNCAWNLYSSMRSDLAMARVDARLRDLGLRRGRRGKRPARSQIG